MYAIDSLSSFEDSSEQSVFLSGILANTLASSKFWEHVSGTDLDSYIACCWCCWLVVTTAYKILPCAPTQDIDTVFACKEFDSLGKGIGYLVTKELTGGLKHIC